MVYHENLVTISCFRTFLIFIQSYIFNFCIYFKCFFLYLYIYIYIYIYIYNIYIAYYMSKSGIWLVISRVVSYFHEPKASANTAYE